VGFGAWNVRGVKQLSPTEIWLFIAGRVLVAFGAGLLIASYLPPAVAFGWPLVLAGAVLLAIAAKGLFRKPPS